MSSCNRHLPSDHYKRGYPIAAFNPWSYLPVEPPMSEVTEPIPPNLPITQRTYWDWTLTQLENACRMIDKLSHYGCKPTEAERARIAACRTDLHTIWLEYHK